jgi:hypothetical protein
MKTKLISVALACVFCFLLTACADSEPKRPIDYPDSKWTWLGIISAKLSFERD